MKIPILDALGVRSSRPKRIREAFDQESAEALREMLHRSAREFGYDSSLGTLEMAAQAAFEEGLLPRDGSPGDNASRHICREVRRWLGSHNREVKESGEGVRIISFLLPKQSPWLNAIERKWVDGKRKVVEPYRLLGAYELAERVCRVFGCPHYEHLSVAQKVA